MVQIKTLADKALLVKLQRSMYQPYAYDDAATKKLESLTGVADAGRYNKRLFKGNMQLKATNEMFYLLYREYIRHTVPWLDDGIRMVPNALYFEFANDMRGLIAKAKQAADDLANNWIHMVQADMLRLGPLANPDDYPSVAEIRKKFDASIQFFPLPSTDDFRITVTDEDKAELDKAIKDAEDNVAKYLLKEMMDPVKAFVIKMSVPIGGKGAVFRDSMIENVHDLVSRLPRLNINQDPQVDTLIKDIQNVVDMYNADPAVLRESQSTRDAARNKMLEVERKLKAMGL